MHYSNNDNNSQRTCKIVEATECKALLGGVEVADDGEGEGKIRDVVESAETLLFIT